MKKNLYVLMALLFSCALMFSCSDNENDPDPDPTPGGVVGPDVNGTYTNGSTLTLTYSGTVLLGGQDVTFTAASDKNTATIVLNGIFPGVASVTLSDVALEASETEYRFGPVEASSNDWDFTYSGTVQEGAMTVALTSIRMPAHELLGTWTLDENSPLFINWESDEEFNITITLPFLGPINFSLAADFLARQIPGQFSDQLPEVLKNVSFLEDGNIVATYSAEDQVSPINMAHYYVGGDQVNILLNTSAIVAVVMGNLASGGGEVDFTEILALIEQFAGLINNGIPLTFTTEGDVLSMTLGTEVILPVVATLLENETLMGLLSTMTFPYSIMGRTIEIPVSLLLPDLPAVVEATTVLEAGLLMNPAE